jgi:hypothetical protein
MYDCPHHLESRSYLGPGLTKYHMAFVRAGVSATRSSAYDFGNRITWSPNRIATRTGTGTSELCPSMMMPLRYTLSNFTSYEFHSLDETRRDKQQQQQHQKHGIHCRIAVFENHQLQFQCLKNRNFGLNGLAVLFISIEGRGLRSKGFANQMV